MRILICADHFYPAVHAGGPPVSLKQLVDTSRHHIVLICRDRDLGSTAPYAAPFVGDCEQGNANINYAQYNSLIGKLRALRWMRRNAAEVLYLNSFHSMWGAILPLIANRVGYLPATTVLLSPRGEFNPAALNLGSPLKGAYIRIWKLLSLQRQVIWIASSEKELQEIHNLWGSGIRTELIPEVSRLVPLTQPSLGGQSSNFILTFISRLAPIKGLREGLEALRSIEADVDLDIYGPLEDLGYWRDCQKILNSLPDNVRTNYRGVASPSRVPEILASSDALLLPTWGENFGHVIGEALAMSCPVIIGVNTPWSPLLRGDGGIAVDPADINSITYAIAHLSALTPEQRISGRLDALSIARAWLGQSLEQRSFDVLLDSLSRDN